jgi:DNA repair exonuclease SbcCD ATPase subunit
MPDQDTTVPNSGPGVQTLPVSPSSADREKEVEEYKNRLAGAISTMDKTRNELKEVQLKLQQKETDYLTQLQQREADHKFEILKKDTSLAELINAKTALEQDHESVRKERDAYSAELARWGMIAENPSMLPYKDILPVTTDVEALKRAVEAINKARQLDRQALADQVRAGQTLPVPTTAPTLEGAIQALNKSVGTSNFDQALKDYHAVEKAVKK